ncbi:MAG TPA: S41 family peptidase [Planctomycetota bacterium]|nr:S41 family peptidase [Planctomycetota bacterium]
MHRCLDMCTVLAAVLSTMPAQVYDDVQKAWAWEQQVRAECRAAREALPLDPADVARSIERLRALLDYFADPRTIAMTGRNSFRYQPEDICIDLALAHARLVMPQEAAAALQDLAARLDARGADVRTWVGAVDRFTAGANSTVRADAAVAAAIRRLAAHDPYARFRARSLTARDGTLTEDQRIAGLSLFWSEVKYNFANFDLVPDLDWDAAYLAALPEVRRAAEPFAYYRLLQRLCARLHDAHTNVLLPPDLQQRFLARPPLRTLLAEGRVFVARCGSPQLRALGLEQGQEIVQVDGEPVAAYAERVHGPYVCASTPQDRTTRLLVHDLLAGPRDEPVALTIEQPGKARRTVQVARQGHDEDERAPDYALSMLPHGVALVTLRTFGDDRVAKAFASDLERVLAADALVLDLRENGGGSSNVGYDVLARLTDRPFRGSRWRTADYRPAYRAWNRESPPHEGEPQSIEPAPGPHFLKPVAVLISARTFSAAEDFAIAFAAMRRGPLVGEATGGSTGQPLFFQLPGGGSARVCTKRDQGPDGQEFVGVGVQPTVPSAPTVADVLAGRDTVLECALAELAKAR